MARGTTVARVAQLAGLPVDGSLRALARGPIEGERVMLKIFVHDETPVTSLVVEGQLVGPRVEELDKCWESIVAAHPRRSMLLDLAHVTFIDSEGRALLTRMRRKGVKLLSAGVLINSIVADIDAQQGSNGDSTE